jgi:hypothetical protein
MRIIVSVWLSGMSAVVILGIFLFVANISRIDLTLVGKSLALVGAIAMLWGIVATWVWSHYYQRSQLQSYWGFIRGLQPSEPGARTAWWWGRQALYAWCAIMLVIILLALIEFR